MVGFHTGGVAAIVENTGAHEYYVDRGYPCQFREALELKRLLRRLVDDRRILDECRDRGLALVRARFSPEAITRKYANLFAALATEDPDDGTIEPTPNTRKRTALPRRRKKVTVLFPRGDENRTRASPKFSWAADSSVAKALAVLHRSNRKAGGVYPGKRMSVRTEAAPPRDAGASTPPRRPRRSPRMPKLPSLTAPRPRFDSRTRPAPSPAS